MSMCRISLLYVLIALYLASLLPLFVVSQPPVCQDAPRHDVGHGEMVLSEQQKIMGRFYSQISSL